MAIEDIDIVEPNQNFFGVNFGTGRLLGAAASDFEEIVGDIILTQEFDTGTDYSVSSGMALPYKPTVWNSRQTQPFPVDGNTSRLPPTV